MRLASLSLAFAAALLASPLAGQTPAAAPAAAATALPGVKFPPGLYLVGAIDPNGGIPDGITFLLREDGNFEISLPTGESMTGITSQKDGVLTWAEERCTDAGQYFVRADGKGFVLEPKDDSCEGRKGQLVLVRFTPIEKP
jgi:hypothetical protein